MPSYEKGLHTLLDCFTICIMAYYERHGVNITSKRSSNCRCGGLISFGFSSPRLTPLWLHFAAFMPMPWSKHTTRSGRPQDIAGHGKYSKIINSIIFHLPVKHCRRLQELTKTYNAYSIKCRIQRTIHVSSSHSGALKPGTSTWYFNRYCNCM